MTIAAELDYLQKHFLGSLLLQWILPIRFDSFQKVFKFISHIMPKDLDSLYLFNHVDVSVCISPQNDVISALIAIILSYLSSRY